MYIFPFICSMYIFPLITIPVYFPIHYAPCIFLIHYIAGISLYGETLLGAHPWYHAMWPWPPDLEPLAVLHPPPSPSSQLQVVPPASQLSAGNYR